MYISKRSRSDSMKRLGNGERYEIPCITWITWIRGVDKMRDFDTFLSVDRRKSAYHIGTQIRKSPCKVCGLYGCICQLSLDQWKYPELDYKVEICPNCGRFLCDSPRDGHGNVIKVGDVDEDEK